MRIEKHQDKRTIGQKFVNMILEVYLDLIIVEELLQRHRSKDYRYHVDNQVQIPMGLCGFRVRTYCFSNNDTWWPRIAFLELINTLLNSHIKISFSVQKVFLFNHFLSFKQYTRPKVVWKVCRVPEIRFSSSRSTFRQTTVIEGKRTIIIWAKEMTGEKMNFLALNHDGGFPLSIEDITLISNEK